MRHRFDYGDAVRVIRNVRNDGTFPGEKTGNLLVRRGSIGYVRDIGTFLQDQIIYTVDFIDSERVVGCREEELIGSDEPWVETRFESRERVLSALSLGMNGKVVVSPGAVGEVIRVLRCETGNSYHVLFLTRPEVPRQTSLRQASPLSQAAHSGCQGQLQLDEPLLFPAQIEELLGAGYRPPGPFKPPPLRAIHVITPCAQRGVDTRSAVSASSQSPFAESWTSSC